MSENVKNFIIPISGLSFDTYSYEFNLDDNFFKPFQHPDVEGGNVKVNVNLTKYPHTIEAEINLKGTLKVECDRCLEKFDYPIKAKETLIYITEKQPDYDEEDTIILPKDAKVIDMSQELYDIAVTCLPISKIHHYDSKNNSTCNPEMLKILEKYIVNNPSNEQTDL